MFPPIQPTGLAYFSWKKISHTPQTVTRLFYTSWEDALWDVLQHYIKQNETILVPEFFCMDVVVNIKSHGYAVSFYPTGKNLQTDLSDFIMSVRRHKPKVIILFHPVGITNNLLPTFSAWKDIISSETIIIEDCVHRIIDPSTIKLLTPRHILIDSLRKVAPLQGSNVYGSNTFLNFKLKPHTQTALYHLTVHLLFFIYQVFLLLKLNMLAEEIMIKTYNIIGDSREASRGSTVYKILAEHININKIKKIKSEQVALYAKYFHAYAVPFAEHDAGELRGYPLLIPFEKKYSIISRLRKHGLTVRLELEGCPWTTRHGVVYLPLGPHVTTTHQNTIITAVKRHFTFLN